LGIITKNINTGLWIGIVLMELQGKFNAKSIENEIRCYLNAIDLKEYLEKEFLFNSNNLLGYIDGPPTLNGEPHVGHLRGRIIKDMWYRLNTIQKKKVIFRAGWDTQGLPVELQAERELGLVGNKTENINKVGIEKIVEACKRIIKIYNAKWVSTDKLLAMSFNYEEAYWTYRDEYIEREWQYLRKAWENGILKEWFRVVAYCPSCQTSLSNAEVNQGYENVDDPSFYYKVKLSGENAFLIVWTTMPFTIVTDEMVAVNPDANYVYVSVDNEKWIIGENRLLELMKELRVGEYEVDRTLQGKDLDGRHYIHPLLHLISGLNDLAKAGVIHLVVAEKFVDITTGSGIVHLSPANGQEDFEIAEKRKLPIFLPIDDRAVFTEKAGFFKDTFVRDADSKVIEAMKEAGAAIKIGTIKHQYPTCWRSHHKLVWLARREYFYIIEKLGIKPEEAAAKVDYFFDPPKNRFLEIIKEKVPWCITRERIWGTPLPIWTCAKCQHKEPAFSRDEIIKKAANLPDGPWFELHRPQIDRVEIRCKKCGETMSREPFVLDTWHNSGAAPYASLNDTEYKTLIPAVFLTEGIDQTRGWAYTLLMENIIMNQSSAAPFKSFLFQGHILDEKGNKMSKSKGNVIDAYTLLAENSVDLVRFYFVWKASPIESLNFSLREMVGRPYQIMSTLYYLHIFFKQNSTVDKFELERNDIRWVLENKLLGLTEIWILSKFQQLILDVTLRLERCKFHEAAKAIEEFIINHLSQMYIPLIRHDIWDDSLETLNRRLTIYSVLCSVLKQLNILLHPISPFITEYLYLTCVGKKKSIMLEYWPKHDSFFVNIEIESTFNKLKDIISVANAARMKGQVKRRWPLRQAFICSSDPVNVNEQSISEILQTQLNVERFTIVKINDKTNIEKISSLLLNNMPITFKVSLVTKNLIPRVKAKINNLISSFEKVDKLELLKTLQSLGRYGLSYEGGYLELTPTDLEFSYDASEGYALAEKNNVIVIIATHRDKALIAKGLLRDLARNLQQLRKERGYNPTDILSTAFIANLEDEEIAILSSFRSELARLVRVNSIILAKESENENRSYKVIDFEGRKLIISVE
jgi:isoleucyl-tRNA synthetase